MKAWLFQDHRQKQKLGDKAPWSVGYVDPDGKRRSKRCGSKSAADKFRRKVEGQLAAGTYFGAERKTWKAFRQEYEEKILAGKPRSTRTAILKSLNHFERVTKPARISAIKTQTIDEFIVQRAKDPGQKLKAQADAKNGKPAQRTSLSPATINRDLRHIKAALRVAHDWGYLPKVPKFRQAREHQQIGDVITDSDFQAIYAACDAATLPGDLACPAAEWWQALLVFAITTGWRINEILALRREDVDLATGQILTRSGDNKGGRDDIDYLPTVALEHLGRIQDFRNVVFYWPHHERTLWVEFARIQKAAGIRLTCRDGREHECTDACHLYGFHALRRGYATLNAESMSPAVLQKKMRHKSFQTTLRYIALADKMKKATDAVHVPEFLRQASG